MDPQPSRSSPGAVDDIAEMIRAAERVTVLTGAGISTESEIPDFRGPNGIWTKDPQAQKMATLQHYMSDPEIRARSWRARLAHPGWTAVPNGGHEALVRLEEMGKLLALVTQNIDGLHQAAGNSADRVIEIHGTMREVVCMSCGDRAAMQKALERVKAGEIDPPCRSCGGILKSATISFGQNLVPADLEKAHQAAEECDLFIAVGTSLTVYPVAQLPHIALSAGASVVVLNAEPTAFDERASCVLRGAIGTILPDVVERASERAG